jgi:hypothetical protein
MTRIDALDDLLNEMQLTADSLPAITRSKIRVLQSDLAAWQQKHGDDAKAVIVLEALCIMRDIRGETGG